MVQIHITRASRSTLDDTENWPAYLYSNGHRSNTSDGISKMNLSMFYLELRARVRVQTYCSLRCLCKTFFRMQKARCDKNSQYGLVRD